LILSCRAWLLGLFPLCFYTTTFDTRKRTFYFLVHKKFTFRRQRLGAVPIFLIAHFLVETKQQKKNFCEKNHPPDRTWRVAMLKNAEYAVFQRMLADLAQLYAHMLSIGAHFFNGDFEWNAAVARAQELVAQSGRGV